MVIYANMHAALEQMRVKAEKARVRGPRVSIRGEELMQKYTYHVRITFISCSQK